MLLLCAACLHNLEEAVAYPLVRPRSAQLLAAIEPSFRLPDPRDFHLALLLWTMVVGGLLLWAATTRWDGQAWITIKAIAFVLLANILVPHVPAAIALGGYAPGVVTAVMLNLPVGLWVLASAPSKSPR